MNGSRTEIDEETFRRFQTGDAAAALVMVELYHVRLTGFLRTQVAQREVAEELAQEVFLEAYLQRRKLRNAAQLKAWLFAVGLRLAARERTRHRREIRIGSDEFNARLEALAAEPQEPGKLLRADVRAQIDRALDELTEQERQLVLLRFFGELPMKELGDTLEMPIGSVGVKLGRALAKVRASLERMGHSLESLLG